MWTDDDANDSEVLDAGLVDSIAKLDQVIALTTGDAQAKATQVKNSNQALLDLIRIMKARHAQ